MKLGFLTAALPDLSLEQVAQWASAEGFESLEVACWPAAGGERRRYAGVTHIDVDSFDSGHVRDVLERHGLEISSLAYYPNNLHPRSSTRLRNWASRSSAPSSATIRTARRARTSSASSASGPTSFAMPGRAA